MPTTFAHLSALCLHKSRLCMGYICQNVGPPLFYTEAGAWGMHTSSRVMFMGCVP